MRSPTVHLMPFQMLAEDETFRVSSQSTSAIKPVRHIRRAYVAQKLPQSTDSALGGGLSSEYSTCLLPCCLSVVRSLGRQVYRRGFHVWSFGNHHGSRERREEGRHGGLLQGRREGSGWRRGEACRGRHRLRPLGRSGINQARKFVGRRCCVCCLVLLVLLLALLALLVSSAVFFGSFSYTSRCFFFPLFTLVVSLMT